MVKISKQLFMPQRFTYDFNNWINSIKIQKYMIKMTLFSAILFAVRRVEFSTDHPRERSL